MRPRERLRAVVIAAAHILLALVGGIGITWSAPLV